MSDTDNDKHEQRSVKKIDVFLTPCEIGDERLKNQTVIVVDVLRAATSIATALANGARYIIPVPSIDEATSLAAQLSRDSVLLCGEREGKIIEGFHIGNSPAEYTRERVRARHLIFGSTNGSPAVVKAAAARAVYMCGLVNLNAVIDAFLSRIDPFPLILLCAGKLSRFAIEDAVCAGMFIDRLRQRQIGALELNDAAVGSEILARKLGKNLESMLRHSDHGKYLIQIGAESDLPLCAADSTIDAAPVLREGQLVKHAGKGSEEKHGNGT
jgi:2-phosphosulfolactate phosphatase